MTSPWAPRLAGRIRAAEDQVKCTSVCGRARSAVAERTTTAGIWPSVTTRGAVRGSTAAGRIVVGARACNACSGTPRCAVVTSAAFACWLTTSMSMTVRIFGVRHRGCASWSALGKCKDWRDAGFAVRGHRSPAQGRSLPCRYVRSPEVTSGLAATFDHRTYRSAPVPECTDSPPAADELFPRSGPLTTWILMCRWKQLLVQAHVSLEETEDEFVFGEPHPDGFSAVLACPVMVGTVPGVRVVVAAAGGLPTRYPAGLEAALEEKPKRLQFRLERVVSLRVLAHLIRTGHRTTA